MAAEIAPTARVAVLAAPMRVIPSTGFEDGVVRREAGVMRNAIRHDLQGIVDLVVDAGLFHDEERGIVEGLLRGHFDAAGESPDVCLVEDDGGGRISGVAYARPREATDRVWDLTMLAVSPLSRRQGVASRLVASAETTLRSRAQRAIMVETSESSAFAGARALYEANGYAVVASVPDYWEDGDSLVLFWKRL